VELDADESAIKRAYRRKVKEVHPDTDGGDEEQFKRVTRAYERLTD
jgi:curved DNA-binding protein CbpA